MVNDDFMGFNGISWDFMGLNQLSMGKFHGFSWDFMGFIRIYDGIPSGND